MNTKHLAFLLLLCIAFSSCDNNANNFIEERKLFPQSADTVTTQLRASPQAFSLNGSRDTVIEGKSGVRISIGANIFVDKNGDKVSDVKLELLEATNVQSFVENGLTTMSGGKILESGGMFYINATSNGKNVSISNDEALTIKVPTPNMLGNMNVFYGRYNDEGKLSWDPVEGEENMKLSFNMIAVPLKHLKYKDEAKSLRNNWLFSEPLVADEIETLNDPAYENTFIATHQFKARLQIHMMGAMVNEDKSIFKNVMDIYKKHIDGNLWEADEEVFTYLSPHYEELMTSMNGDDDKLGMAKGFREFGKVCWDVLKSCPDAKYTSPIDFKELGIAENTTKEDLVNKGISPADADRYLFMYNEYKSSTNFEEVKAYTISVSQLGWVNIDRFLDDPTCKESKLTVDVKGVKDNTVKLMLIFPLRNICVEAIKNEGTKYSFTNKSGMYRKLPIGEEAIIIGLSSQNGKPYYGFTKIKIPVSGEFSIELNETTKEDIKTSMAKVLKAKRPKL